MENGFPTITVNSNSLVIRTDVKIDVEGLNSAFLTLPAKTYLDLFREMYAKIYGYPPLMNCGGCCGSSEDIASDYSEQLKKSKHEGDSPLTDFTEFPRERLCSDTEGNAKYYGKQPAVSKPYTVSEDK